MKTAKETNQADVNSPYLKGFDPGARLPKGKKFEMAVNVDLSPQFKIEEILMCLTYKDGDVSLPATESASFVTVDDAGSRPTPFTVEAGQLRSNLASGTIVTALCILNGNYISAASAPNGPIAKAAEFYKGSSYIVE